jgi:hypothetical protein
MRFSVKIPERGALPLLEYGCSPPTSSFWVCGANGYLLCGTLGLTRYREYGIAGWAEHRLRMRRKKDIEARPWVTRERPKVDRIACPWRGYLPEHQPRCPTPNRQRR